MPNQGINVRSKGDACSNAFRFIPLLNERGRKIPPEGEFKLRFIPDLLDSTTILIAQNIERKTLNCYGRSTKPGILPEPIFPTITDFPPITKLNTIHSPHNSFPELGNSHSSATKDVWVFKCHI
jgi:hypothetical protein